LVEEQGAGSVVVHDSRSGVFADLVGGAIRYVPLAQRPDHDRAGHGLRRLAGVHDVAVGLAQGTAGAATLEVFAIGGEQGGLQRLAGGARVRHGESTLGADQGFPRGSALDHAKG
jgi:hypothetical protein